MQCSECSRPVQGSGDTARQERSRADLPRSPRPQMETRRAVATDNAHVGSSHSRDRSKRLRGLPSRSACAVVAHSDRRHHAMAASAHCARRLWWPESGGQTGTEMCMHRPLAHEQLPRCFVGGKNKTKTGSVSFSSSSCFPPDIARLFRPSYKSATLLNPYYKPAKKIDVHDFPSTFPSWKAGMSF